MAKRPPRIKSRTGSKELAPLHDHLPHELPAVVSADLRRAGVGQRVTLKRHVERYGGLHAFITFSARDMVRPAAMPSGEGFTLVRTSIDGDDIVVHESWLAKREAGVLDPLGEAVLAAVAREVAGRRYRVRHSQDEGGAK